MIYEVVLATECGQHKLISRTKPGFSLHHHISLQFQEAMDSNWKSPITVSWEVVDPLQEWRKAVSSAFSTLHGCPSADEIQPADVERLLRLAERDW